MCWCRQSVCDPLASGLWGQGLDVPPAAGRNNEALFGGQCSPVASRRPVIPVINNLGSASPAQSVFLCLLLLCVCVWGGNVSYRVMFKYFKETDCFSFKKTECFPFFLHVCHLRRQNVFHSFCMCVCITVCFVMWVGGGGLQILIVFRYLSRQFSFVFVCVCVHMHYYMFVRGGDSLLLYYCKTLFEREREGRGGRGGGDTMEPWSICNVSAMQGTGGRTEPPSDRQWRPSVQQPGEHHAALWVLQRTAACWQSCAAPGECQDWLLNI